MSIVLALVGGGVSIGIYWLLMKFMAGRKVPELHVKRAGTETIFGATIGLVLIAVSVGIIVLFGGYSFQWSADRFAMSVIASAIGAAILEELVFRGIMLQAIEKMGGSWIALAVTSIFFGGAHLVNEGATIWSAIAIFIEAGILLGAGFLWRRNIWFVVGLHFAWNALEGLLGIPVSGVASKGLFEVTLSGSTLLTGGSFGLEASVVPIIVSLMIAIPMMIAASRRGNLQNKRNKGTKQIQKNRDIAG